MIYMDTNEDNKGSFCGDSTGREMEGFNEFPSPEVRRGDDDAIRLFSAHRFTGRGRAIAVRLRDSTRLGCSLSLFGLEAQLQNGFH